VISKVISLSKSNKNYHGAARELTTVFVADIRTKIEQIAENIVSFSQSESTEEQ
jgi:hypothetical protein